MARVALIFLFAFCVFQISTAAPAEGNEPIQEITLDQQFKKIGEAINNVFTKEDLENIQNNAKKIGETINNVLTKEDLEKIQNNAKVFMDNISKQSEAIGATIKKQIEDFNKEKKENAPQ